MKFQVISDLHCEWYPKNYDKLLTALAIKDVDGVIIAGDLGSVKYLPAALDISCSLWKRVIYVAGNHEYYHIGRKVHDFILDMKKQHKNLHWLDNSSIVIDDVVLFGTTLWFPDDPINMIYENKMNDFRVIPQLRQWVYKENRLAVDSLTSFLKKRTNKTIVISHHAPSEQSISEYYKYSTVNRFFVCDVENLIQQYQPNIWIHGHMHGSFDYMINNTRVICNPRGYPYNDDDITPEDIENSKFNEFLTIEI